MLVDIENERVVRVRGDRDHPATHGYTCPKGRALGVMHRHPRRLERPQRRTSNGFEAISWEHCLDDLGARLRSVIDRYGPASVGIFFGSGVGMDAAGYRMAEALHVAIGTPARFSPLTIDGTAKTLIGCLVAGFPGFSPRPDYERTQLVIYIGINPLISHGHTVAMPDPARIVRALAKQGEVWVIDPRHSETAKYANRHIAPQPGMDYAILAYLGANCCSKALIETCSPARLFLGDKPEVLVNPIDARPLGIEDGQPVIVRTARGEITGLARVDARIRPGVVSVPHGHEHANVNYLTSIAAVDPITGMVRYSGFPVTLHAVAPDRALSRGVTR